MQSSHILNSVQQQDVKCLRTIAAQEGKMKQLNYCHLPPSAGTADDSLTAKFILKV
jgi:hypothetical protein